MSVVANSEPHKHFPKSKSRKHQSNVEMDDKVVLVTGSSAGIGESSVIKFSELGCKVVVHGTDMARVDKVVERCKECSPKKYEPLKIIADLKDSNNVEKIIVETIRFYSRLDVLVNNAGLFQPTTVDDSDAYKTFSDLLRINLDSAVQLTILAVPHLRKTKGCIINISSNLHAKCINGGFAYCTAKAGLTMFTKSIAVDLAPDVRVNSVSPGPIATLMPTRCGMKVDGYRNAVGSACLVNRVGEPDEVARVVVFLASPESAFITGSDIIVDGGSTLKPEGKVMGRD